MCIKYASDADSASDGRYHPLSCHGVFVAGELLPTGLGWVNDKASYGNTPYPLSASTMKKMLKHKLEVEINGIGKDMTHAEQLIAFIKNRLAAFEMVCNPPWEVTLSGSQGLSSPQANGYVVKALQIRCWLPGYPKLDGSHLPYSWNENCGDPVAVHLLMLSFFLMLQSFEVCFWRRFQDVAVQSSGALNERSI
ncbi:hypothetical protein Tco_0937071 [Tanacetum coccineum]|uniref:Uncharacterized protein n=1 Tax=Tanacetum coccineum TaxID=301880 RepID=A0ABQ5DDA4_9ASTR